VALSTGAVVVVDEAAVVVDEAVVVEDEEAVFVVDEVDSSPQPAATINNTSIKATRRADRHRIPGPPVLPARDGAKEAHPWGPLPQGSRNGRTTNQRITAVRRRLRPETVAD
jgi:hypothetical protein